MIEGRLETEASMREAIPKELSSTAWAFAKVAYVDHEVFMTISDIAECHVGEKFIEIH